ncbi:MAG: NADH-quinone oxidoreductase subunit C [Bacteroidetes bacterium]|nr:NADH-quinone oxidoreductase subunit C [Bacteroidota bacterium]
MAISSEQILEKLSAVYGENILAHSEPFGMLKIEYKAEIHEELVRTLRDDETLKFRFLTDLCAVHYPDDKGREIAVVCHLHSLENNFRLRLECRISESKPEIASLTTLFAGANWMERETYDFFGINFTGHPDLRRILNVDHMDFFPMLKQYPLEDSSREDKDDRFFGR